MDLINRVFGYLERQINTNRVNWFKTIYFNFRMMPFNQARKLPVYIYSHTRLISLLGSVSFDCTPRKGMVKIGRHRDYYSPLSDTIINIGVRGRVIFNGKCYVSQGTIIIVHGGVLNIGSKVGIGQSVLIDCCQSIKIGYDSRIAFGCKLMDSNHHYIIESDGTVRKKEGEIIIGQHNWIGNNSVANKGCVTSDFTIVSHGSLLNKDYIQKYETVQPMCLAGVPAKMLKTDYQRIFSGEIEKKLEEYFVLHSHEDSVRLNFSLNSNETEDIYY